MSRTRERLTRDDLAKLLKEGWTFKGASLYEPDHAPKGTRFAVYAPIGLIRLTPPKRTEN
jgi:hypothetical protein